MSCQALSDEARNWAQKAVSVSVVPWSFMRLVCENLNVRQRERERERERGGGGGRGGGVPTM